MTWNPDDTQSFDLREPRGDFDMINEHYGIRDRGENVNLAPRAVVITEHKSRSATHTPDSNLKENFFMYSKHGSPCSAPLLSLQRIFVKDLKLGCDYHESVAVLRTIVPSRRFGNVLQTVVEDEQGSCINLRFYGPVAGAFVDPFLPEGSVVAVKAPWCQCNRIHGTAIVVHHFTDFIRLAQGGILYPEKWNLSVPPSAPSASEWFKEEGNTAYRSRRYQTAVVRYTEALNFKPGESLEIAIYSNRAQAHLASGAFEAAISDATFVLSREPQHERALYRCAMGHYALQNYAGAIKLLNSLVQAYPSNETAKNDLQRAAQRVKEQSTGAYDFAEMLKVSLGPYPQMDVADYIGPVRQEAGGLFATRDIAAGELLMCTKAFEFFYADINEYPVFLNSKTFQATSGAPLRLSRKIAQKLALNPSYIPSFRKLHRHSLTMVGEFSDELIDGRPVMDEFFIESILKPHTFAMPCVHGTEHMYNGIGWSLNGSHIRYECLGNCRRAVIGDVAIYRASHDIEIGAEIRALYLSPQIPVEKRQKTLRSYGIHCNCACFCLSQLAEAGTGTREQRRALIETAPTVYEIHEKPVKAAQDLDKLCTRVESTYLDPPTIQPRFCYIDKLVLLSISCTMKGNRRGLLETSLRGLSAMGFDAKVDETGHLHILRHGFYDGDIIKLAVLQASWFLHEGLVTQSASWKAFARKAMDICGGHWSFLDDQGAPGPLPRLDFSVRD